MKPAPFAYHAPKSLDETTRLLETLDDAELMAGNLWLGFAMSKRVLTPDHVIDINGLADLDYIAVSEETIEIGALTSHRTIERSSRLDATVPILPESATKIAGPAVKNMGTIGGTLGEANPAGNYPTVLQALDATVHVTSATGDRTISIEDFFRGYMETALASNELISHVSVPRERFPVDRSGMAFRDLKTVPHTAPLLSAAAAVRVADPRTRTPEITKVGLAVGNAAEVPLRVRSAEDALVGAPLSEETLEAAVAATVDAADPVDAVHADADYKTAQVGVYTRRALEAAYDRAIDSPS